MARHVMTPARRAALRKAQLASARKRRKGGVRSAARRNISHARSRRSANKQLRHAATARNFHKATGAHLASGPGSIHKNVNSVLRSKKTSKFHKAVVVYNTSPAVYLGSKARGAHHARKARKRK
jgi:hypothetical protein